MCVYTQHFGIHYTWTWQLAIFLLIKQLLPWPECYIAPACSDKAEGIVNLPENLGRSRMPERMNSMARVDSTCSSPLRERSDEARMAGSGSSLLQGEVKHP